MLDQQEWDVIEYELTRFLVDASIQYSDFFLVDDVVYQVRAIARRFHNGTEGAAEVCNTTCPGQENHSRG